MTLPEYDITGKIAFVTGAGRGICKGIAEVFAEAGADVAINARTAKYLEPTAAAIAKATGRRVLPVAADLTKSDEVKRAVPMGRPGQFREVGLLALYLAAPASEYMTGQTLFIDGGMSL